MALGRGAKAQVPRDGCSPWKPCLNPAAPGGFLFWGLVSDKLPKNPVRLGHLLRDGARAGAGKRPPSSPGPATSAHSAPPGPPEAVGGEKTGQTSSAWHQLLALAPPPPPALRPLSQGAQGTLSLQGPGLRSGTAIGANCRRQPSGLGAKGRYEKERKERRRTGRGGVIEPEPHTGDEVPALALLLPNLMTLNKALTLSGPHFVHLQMGIADFSLVGRLQAERLAHCLQLLVILVPGP